MGKTDMIKGVKRKSTAVESTTRYFQTINLIITHFKREADREKIFELIDENATLKDFLIATAAVHLYHSLGIRVEHALEIDKTSVESTQNLELIEKKILIEEISLLLKDSFNLEIDSLYRIMERENKFLSFYIDERIFKRHKERDVGELEEDIEKELLEIIRNQYPQFFFYDMISDTIGLTDEIKNNILVESSGLKDLSIEIEKKLEREEKEDKFIEISTLHRIIEKIQTDFEFKSYKELELEIIPLKKIKRRIFEYYFNCFPISVPGLEVFLETNDLKKQLINKIDVALNEKINYEQFEKNMLDFLKDKIVNKLKTNPNDFVYFLQNLNESNFTEIIYLLNKYGIYNILQIMNLNEDIAKKVKQYMIRYNIDKYDIMALNDPNKNLIFLEKRAKFDSNLPVQKELELQKFMRKKELIDKVFFEDLKLKDYSQILLLLSFEDILDKLVKEIFFYVFSKVFRPLGRIIELYSKVSNNKALFLLALKKMSGTTDSEEWVFIKLEELLINRIIKMQEELVVILNSRNQPFLINGFIYARLTDSSLKECILKLKEEPSPIYKNIMPIKLDSDLISPVSYCLAFDLIKRFEIFEELRKQEVQNTIELKKRKKEEKIKKLRKKQEGSTLNWIERRITSSLIGVNKSGFNPNQLYWQEKDTKTAMENIKLHSELDGDTIELFSQYFNFTIEKIKNFAPDLKFYPDYEKIKNVIRNITNRVLEERLRKPPTLEDIKNMIEGERFEIAGQVAKRIGKILDKTLYTKFKQKKR